MRAPRLQTAGNIRRAWRGSTICMISGSLFLPPIRRAASGTAFSWLAKNSAAERADAHQLAALSATATAPTLDNTLSERFGIGKDGNTRIEPKDASTLVAGRT